MREIVHPNHPHILYSVTFASRLYTCSWCKEHGQNHAYICKRKRCENFYLHKECATACSLITHHFFGRHTFRLHYSPPPGKKWVCQACFRDVGGLGYYCEKKGWSLHPRCAKLGPIIKTSKKGSEIRLEPKISSKCKLCKVRKPHGRPGGWSYVSNCGNFHFHVGCIKDAMVQVPSNGLVRPDGGRLNLVLFRPDGGKDLARRLKRYLQVAKALFQCVLSVFLGIPPTGELVQLFLTIFQQNITT